MELTKAEQEMLSGKQGRGTAKCMQLLVAMGEVCGAKKMVPITSGHIAGNYPSWVMRVSAGLKSL